MLPVPADAAAALGGLLERDDNMSNSSSMPPGGTPPPVTACAPLDVLLCTGSHGDDDATAFCNKLVSSAASAHVQIQARHILQ